MRCKGVTTDQSVGAGRREVDLWMCGWGVSVSVQALHQPDPTSRPPGPHRDPPACLIGRSHRAYRLPSRAQSHYISITWQRRVPGTHLIASPRVAAACVRAFIQSPSHRDSCAASPLPPWLLPLSHIRIRHPSPTAVRTPSVRLCPFINSIATIPVFSCQQILSTSISAPFHRRAPRLLPLPVAPRFSHSDLREGHQLPHIPSLDRSLTLPPQPAPLRSYPKHEPASQARLGRSRSSSVSPSPCSSPLATVTPTRPSDDTANVRRGRRVRRSARARATAAATGDVAAQRPLRTDRRPRRPVSEPTSLTSWWRGVVGTRVGLDPNRPRPRCPAAPQAPLCPSRRCLVSGRAGAGARVSHGACFPCWRRPRIIACWQRESSLLGGDPVTGDVARPRVASCPIAIPAVAHARTTCGYGSVSCGGARLQSRLSTRAPTRMSVLRRGTRAPECAWSIRTSHGDGGCCVHPSEGVWQRTKPIVSDSWSVREATCVHSCQCQLQKRRILVALRLRPDGAMREAHGVLRAAVVCHVCEHVGHLKLTIGASIVYTFFYCASLRIFEMGKCEIMRIIGTISQ
ncbi:hypothetical protein AcW1_007143 [Taiwanofungus camphoratus]|nr:hypothetical protein AcW1_007143 [Antrodia cinnamomea]